MPNDDSSLLRLLNTLAEPMPGYTTADDAGEVLGKAVSRLIPSPTATSESPAGAAPVITLMEADRPASAVPQLTLTESVERLMPSSSENEEAGRLTRQLAELTNVARQQVEITDANTQAVIENSLARATGEKKSTAANIGNTLLSFLGGSFGLFQLVGKLFAGGESESTPTLPADSLPAAVNVEAGVVPGVGGVYPLRYAQDGLARPVTAVSKSEQTTNVTVQVQAMDSRSFLDHSDEIAQAVREALLHSHPLSDVMSEF